MDDEQPGAERGLPLLQRVVRHRYTRAQLVGLDVLAAALLFLLATYAGPHKSARLSGSTWDTVNGVLDGLAAAALLSRHHHPRAALALLLPMSLTVIALRGNGPAAFYTALVLYSVIVTSPRRTGLRVLAVVLGSAEACVVIGGGGLEASSATGLAAILLLGWVAGESARANRRYARYEADREVERAAEAELRHSDQIDQAIAGERVKIARDLHDIVAHAMSVIAVRSGVARMVIDTQPDEAREALSIIETTTRRTLHEMRLLVGMLRDRDPDEPGAELGPIPGVRDLARLLHEIELAGVSASLEVIGVPRPLPPAADLSIYRIVQEALTNIVRHAGPTSATVQIGYRPAEISIDVRNVRSTVDGGRVSVLTRRGSGHGIIGMRERAALFGGALHAGPSDDGFRVQAILRTDD